jgi:hypothetical protein
LLRIPPKRCATERLVGFADGWTVIAGTRDMLATRGRIGWRYFERPHAIKAV